MTLQVKVFVAASAEAVEKKANQWLAQCEADEDHEYVVESMQMATYPGASTGLTFFFDRSPLSEEAKLEADQQILNRLMERARSATTKVDITPKADPRSAPPPIELSAQERVAQMDAEREAEFAAEDAKPCGCKPNEMCRVCDNGVPLNEGMAMLLRGLPSEAERNAAAEALGAGDEAMELFQKANEGATPVE